MCFVRDPQYWIQVLGQCYITKQQIMHFDFNVLRKKKDSQCHRVKYY